MYCYNYWMDYSDRFKPGSIEASRQPGGGRSLAEYEKILQFSRQDLRNRRVLDLGAGPLVKVSKTLREEGITNDVYSLSPDFSDQKYKDMALGSEPNARIVAGVGQHLDFPDNYFDVILCLHVIDHLPPIADKQRLLLEVGRCLRTNGFARVGPCWQGEYNLASSSQELAQLLHQKGLTVDQLELKGYRAKVYLDDSDSTGYWAEGYTISYHPQDTK